MQSPTFSTSSYSVGESQVHSLPTMGSCHNSSTKIDCLISCLLLLILSLHSSAQTQDAASDSAPLACTTASLLSSFNQGFVLLADIDLWDGKHTTGSLQLSVIGPELYTVHVTLPQGVVDLSRTVSAPLGAPSLGSTTPGSGVNLTGAADRLPTAWFDELSSPTPLTSSFSGRRLRVRLQKDRRIQEVAIEPSRLKSSPGPREMQLSIGPNCQIKTMDLVILSKSGRSIGIRHIELDSVRPEAGVPIAHEITETVLGTPVSHFIIRSVEAVRSR